MKQFLKWAGIIFLPVLIGLALSIDLSPAYGSVAAPIAQRAGISPPLILTPRRGVMAVTVQG